MLGSRALGALVKYLPFRYLPGAAAALIVVMLVGLGLVEEREYWSLERFFEVRGERQPVAPIVIIAIDESSFIELDHQWPFPRAWHAQLLQALAAAHPLAIGIDLQNAPEGLAVAVALLGEGYSRRYAFAVPALHRGGHQRRATVGLAAMLFLDVWLG